MLVFSMCNCCKNFSLVICEHGAKDGAVCHPIEQNQYFAVNTIWTSFNGRVAILISRRDIHCNICLGYSNTVYASRIVTVKLGYHIILSSYSVEPTADEEEKMWY